MNGTLHTHAETENVSNMSNMSKGFKKASQFTAALWFHMFAEEWHEAYRILTCSSADVADVLLVDQLDQFGSCFLEVKPVKRVKRTYPMTPYDMVVACLWHVAASLAVSQEISSRTCIVLHIQQLGSHWW